MGFRIAAWTWPELHTYVSSLASMRLLAAEVLASHFAQPHKEPGLLAGTLLIAPYDRVIDSN